MLIQFDNFEDWNLRPGILIVAAVGVAALAVGLTLSAISDKDADGHILRVGTFIVAGLTFFLAVLGAYADKRRAQKKKDYAEYLSKVRVEVMDSCNKRRRCTL